MADSSAPIAVTLHRTPTTSLLSASTQLSLPLAAKRLTHSQLASRGSFCTLSFLARSFSAWSTSGHIAEIDRLRKIACDTRSLAAITDWQSADGRHTLFRLLAVATWPLRAVQGPKLYLSRALAAVFRSCEMKNHHTRPLATYWSGWAHPAVMEIFRSWNAASGIPPVPDLLFVPEARPAKPVGAPGDGVRRSGRLRRTSQRVSGTITDQPEASYIDFDDASDLSSDDK